MSRELSFATLDADGQVPLDQLDNAPGGSGAPDTADYLVGTANAGLSAEIINTGAASFGIGGSAVSGNLTNNADAGKRFGLCVNTGASAAWTVNSVMGELT